MGCGPSKEKEYDILEEYHSCNLTQPWSGEYTNEFEKRTFMAINLLRYDPKRFIPIVKKVHKTNTLTKEIKNTDKLMEALKTTESLN